MDGTHKLDCGRGVLINIGVTVVYVTENGAVIHRTFQVMHVWSQTENAEAMIMGFDWLKVVPTVFFECTNEFMPPVACIDHCPAATQAAEHVWPGIRMITCEIHVLRAIDRKPVNISENRERIKSDISLLKRIVVSDKMMETCLDITSKAWENMGEKTFGDSFTVTYGGVPYYRFYLGSSLIIGLTPNNNPMEGAHNGQKKALTRKELYADASQFLNDSMGTIVAREDPVTEEEVSAPRFM